MSAAALTYLTLSGVPVTFDVAPAEGRPVVALVRTPDGSTRPVYPLDLHDAAGRVAETVYVAQKAEGESLILGWYSPAGLARAVDAGGAAYVRPLPAEYGGAPEHGGASADGGGASEPAGAVTPGGADGAGTPTTPPASTRTPAHGGAYDGRGRVVDVPYEVVGEAPAQAPAVAAAPAPDRPPVAPERRGPSRPVTRAQRLAIRMDWLGYDRDAALAFVADAVGRRVASRKELAPTELALVHRALNRLEGAPLNGAARAD